MNIQDKLNIYEILLTNYSVGDTIPLASAGQLLSMHGISPKYHGFDKLLEMFNNLSEICSLSSKLPREGVPLVWYVTILPRPALNGENLEGLGQTESEEHSVCSAELPSQPENTPENEPGNYSDILPESLDIENVIIAKKITNLLCSYITGNKTGETIPGIYDVLKSDYKKALASNSIIHDETHDCYTFQLESYKAANGNPIIVSLSRCDESYHIPWRISFVSVDFTYTDSRPSNRPGDSLINFAYLGHIPTFLANLAEHVQAEPWTFTNTPNDYTILRQYITYTFYRLQQEDKICISENGEFAAFNTGLQSRKLGEDVFAYFVPNDAEQKNIAWKFHCFCSADSRDPGERVCYKNIIDEFREPPLASYFSKITDLLFDANCAVRISSDHIFKDNCDRFPLSFLKHECELYPEAAILIEQIEATEDAAERKELFERLGEEITDNLDLFSALNDKLRGALDRTIKKLRRNYKLAVPCFFPTRGVMSMMLPLSFTATGAPTLVLVCERTLSGDYLGQTVFTLPMAYIDARLLCRPGSEWLNAEHISSNPIDMLSLD